MALVCQLPNLPQMYKVTVHFECVPMPAVFEDENNFIVAKLSSVVI